MIFIIEIFNFLSLKWITAKLNRRIILTLIFIFFEKDLVYPVYDQINNLKKALIYC